MKLDPLESLFSAAWRTFRNKFTKAASVIIAPFLLIGIGSLLALSGQPVAAVLGAVIVVIGYVFSMFSSIALVAVFGKNADFGSAYKTAATLFWAWVWVEILVGLAVMGGFVLLIVPGIILAIQFAMVNFLVILEDRRGMAALVQSREYMKGYWWAFAGRTGLLLLMWLAASLVFIAPTHVLFGQLAANVVYAVLVFIYMPFAVAYSYEIYENLRRLKPELASAPAKTDSGFLKVAVVFGVIGIFIWIFIIIVISALVGRTNKLPDAYYSTTSTSTSQDLQVAQ